MSTPNPVSDPKTAARKLTFQQTLAALDKGRFPRDLADANKEIVEAIMKRGGKGKMTITLDYTKGKDGVNITADLAVKKPKQGRSPDFVFASESGDTFMEDPNQTEMEDVIKFEQPTRAASGQQFPLNKTT